jgi:hypothetical protein
MGAAWKFIGEERKFQLDLWMTKYLKRYFTFNDQGFRRVLAITI